MDNWPRWDEEKANQAPTGIKQTDSSDFDDLDAQLDWIANFERNMANSMPVNGAESSLGPRANASMGGLADELAMAPAELRSVGNLDIEVPPESQKPFKVMKITKPKLSSLKKPTKERLPKADPKLMRILVGCKLSDYTTTKNWLNMVAQEPSSAKFIRTEYAALQSEDSSLMYAYEIGLLRSDGTWSKEVKVYYLNGDIYSKHSADWMAELTRDRSVNRAEGTKVIIVCEGIVSQILAHSAKREYNLKSNISMTERQAPVQLPSNILEHGTSSLIDILTKLKQEPVQKPARGSKRKSEGQTGSGLFQDAQELRNFLVRESVDHGACGEIFMDSMETEELLCSLTRTMLRSRKSLADICTKVAPGIEEASQNDSLASSRSNSNVFKPQDDALGCSSRGRLFLKKQTDIQTVEDDLMSIGSASRGNRSEWSHNSEFDSSHRVYDSPSASDDEELPVICEESAEKTDEKPSMSKNSETKMGLQGRQTGQTARRGIEAEGRSLNKYWAALLQCVPTISEAKALGIAKVFTNGYELHQKVASLGKEQAEKQLSTIPFVHPKKGSLTPIGKSSAALLVKVFSCLDAFASLKNN